MKHPLVAAALATLALAGCGTAGSAGGSGSPEGGALDVTAAFYPLAYAVERVGGDRVTVSSLTRPGAEPHDVELTPKDVATLGRSALVVYEKGFQPAVDDAVEQVDGANALDVSTSVDLTLEAAHDGHDHGDEGAQEGMDPHFWLDPTRYASAVKAIADRLATADPGGATAYATNAQTFVAELTALDAEFATALRTCTTRELVTGHAAFGYLADRYDLHQVGIAGISPDAEPNAAAMREVVAHVREAGVGTVYAETLGSTALPQAIARETGARVAVLDPIEGLSDASAGKNYLEVMRANLATLVAGQGCS